MHHQDGRRVAAGRDAGQRASARLDPRRQASGFQSVRLDRRVARAVIFLFVGLRVLREIRQIVALRLQLFDTRAHVTVTVSALFILTRIIIYFEFRLVVFARNG